MSASKKKSPRPSGATDSRASTVGDADAHAAPAPVVAAAARPWTVTITAAIVLVEALAIWVVAVMQLADLGSPSPLTMAGRIFLPVLMIGAGAWQVMVGLKHRAGRAWTRAAVVVWQLFQIILSIQYLVSAPQYGDWLGFAVGLGLFIPGAVALVLVFSPTTRLFLEADDQASARARQG